MIAVCASLGGVFILAFLALGLFCLAKKKKKPVMVPAAPCVDVEEHAVVHEVITTGPCGEQSATVDIEEDVEIHVAGGAVTGSGVGVAAVGAQASCEHGPTVGSYHEGSASNSSC